MGFYLRKSIAVGPFRFGLSRSGINVSVGVKGLRVGSGPRGTYVHMGLGGVYYRAAIPRLQPSGPARPAPLPTAPRAPAVPPPAAVAASMSAVDSAAAADICDSSSAALLEEINEKRRKIRLWPIAMALTVIALIATLYRGGPWLAAIVAVSGAAAVGFAYRRDVLAKTVVLLYQMDAALERAYDGFHASALQLAACRKVWHVQAEGRVADSKYNAGAEHVVRRAATFVRRSRPPYLQTNVDTIAVGVGNQTLYFFPDRLLVVDARGVGAVSYARLELDAATVRFVEHDKVAGDATVVDRTWQYVNRQGGPDRRFKDNRQLPVCLYDELSIRSATGLNERLQLSRRGTADAFARAVRQLASHLPP